jgi:hypothetical protein
VLVTHDPGAGLEGADRVLALRRDGAVAISADAHSVTRADVDAVYAPGGGGA